MSRVIVFGLDNKSIGEFTATVNRGYMVYGNPSVSGENSTQIVIPEDILRKGWLDFGRLVMISHPYIEPWVGVLDPPWRATLPVTVNLYSAEYLLALRSADSVQKMEAPAATILTRMVQIANGQEELFLRMGSTSASDGQVRQETITQKKIWEQMRAFCDRTRTEMIVRPDRNEERLFLYVDLSSRFGVDTGYELHDGDGANMVIKDAVVLGPLTNRMVGTSTQNTQASRPTVGPLSVDDMIARYRLRSELVQFRDVTELATLQRHTKQAVEFAAYPRLQITVEILLEDADLARLVRRGNEFIIRASKLYLPGGKVGWSGRMRIVKYFYTETTNTASVTMEATL